MTSNITPTILTLPSGGTPSSEVTSSRLETIPLELFLEIFAYLTNYEDQNNLSMTCRTLRALCSPEKLNSFYQSLNARVQGMFKEHINIEIQKKRQNLFQFVDHCYFAWQKIALGDFSTKRDQFWSPSFIFKTYCDLREKTKHPKLKELTIDSSNLLRIPEDFVIQEILDGEVDINYRYQFDDNLKQSLLQYVTEPGHTFPNANFPNFSSRAEVVAYLLSIGADLNVRDEFKNTLLHHAILWELDLETTKQLIYHPNRRTIEGNTPLHLAVSPHYAENKDYFDLLLGTQDWIPTLKITWGTLP